MNRDESSTGVRTPTRARPTAARQHTLREYNLALVSQALFDAPRPRSRADIAAATGLTRATVSVLVDQLIEARLVRELPPVTPLRAGRPAVPLTPAERTIVGLGLEVNVDYLGGTVLDLTGQVVAQEVVPGDLHGSDPAEVLGRLGALARRLVEDVEAQDMQAAGARLALPGLVDARAGRLQVAPNLGWSSFLPLPLLGLPDRLPVEIANEANLAGLAQLVAGAQGRRPDDAAPPVPSSFLYVSGEVGIGSAIVIDRELFLGNRGWSGEIGHVVVDPHGPRCLCGATGCLEQYAGKDAMLRAAGIPMDAPVETFLDALAEGTPSAREAATSAGTALGRALANFVNLVDIETVLLGGIYTDLLPYLREALTTELTTRVLASPWTELDLRPALVAGHAAMIGGARTVLRDVVAAPSAWTTSD
ncbi:ROK family transcriptional regulator [Oerskovia sp. KBS0722]|uniref:ROK family transcriptional regulator n=1 Tax=Oerskovia sp. KBS0722 TaxID=1179673 RepID=UPI00110E3ED2|nr:ROK family transcriptional regulator [Oerskovia sp. KBS0722]QDW62398.1 ROK family transcriptional regulator [Oerskovia sp. KBS0722]